MSQPIVRHSIEGAVEPTVGSEVNSLGHYHTGLFVSADPGATSLTVQLEVTPNGSDWAVAESTSGGPVEITEADLNDDGNAHVSTPGLYGAYLRARVTEYDAAGEVDSYVITAGNAGQGRKATGRKGPVTDLDL